MVRLCQEIIVFIDGEVGSGINEVIYLRVGLLDVDENCSSSQRSGPFWFKDLREQFFF